MAAVWPLKEKYRVGRRWKSAPYSSRTNHPTKNLKGIKHPIGFSGRTLAIKGK